MTRKSYNADFCSILIACKTRHGHGSKPLNLVPYLRRRTSIYHLFRCSLGHPNFNPLPYRRTWQWQVVNQSLAWPSLCLQMSVQVVAGQNCNSPWHPAMPGAVAHSMTNYKHPGPQTITRAHTHTRWHTTANLKGHASAAQPWPLHPCRKLAVVNLQTGQHQV